MIELTVIGTPAPQGSKSAVVRGSHAVLIEGSSTKGRNAHRAWREAVAWEAHAVALRHGHFDDDAPLRITAEFWMPKPKSRPKRARWADRKPDIDKLLRSTLDGLADGGLVRHDSRVVDVRALKRYVVPGRASGAVLTVEYAATEVPDAA